MRETQGYGAKERAARALGSSKPGREATRKRVAIEMVARHEGSLRRTARRYSLCEDDADDAYQRGLEILLTKAPTDDLRELIRWTQTVVKHEALSVRRNRERMLAGPPPAAPDTDWVALIPAEGADPAERVERREAIARSREALQSLKPQELRALTLLAEGYSYAEIGEITGYSRTKVNRCLAEGRDRFRRMLSSSLDGSRCDEIRPLLSAFCDGEGEESGAAAVREHLHVCPTCRSTMRAFRAAPGAAAALAPGPAIPRSLLDRVHEALVGIHSRLPGRGGGATDPAMSQIAAAGGSRGVGAVVLAKLLALCIGTAGGAAACVAGGIAPLPAGLGPSHQKPVTLERPSSRVTDALASAGAGPTYEPAPIEHDPPPQEPAPETVAVAAPPPVTPTGGAVEYVPEAAAPPPPAGTGSSSDSAAGEFGP